MRDARGGRYWTWPVLAANVAGEPAWRDGAAMAAEANTMEKIVALCKRRGFIFQSSEIYGGIGGFWDYGPLGTELKRNIKDAWWQDMVRNPPPGPDGQDIQMVGVDCSIIMNPKVWEASGHVGGFSDPMVDCQGVKGAVSRGPGLLRPIRIESTKIPVSRPRSSPQDCWTLESEVSRSR
jgi:hypothetical protein